MKKTALLLGLFGLLTLVSCSKEKTCRCAVLGKQTIRLVQIDKGDCKDIRFVFYDRDGGLIPSDQNLTDSVLCTDYQFE